MCCTLLENFGSFPKTDPSNYPQGPKHNRKLQRVSVWGRDPGTCSERHRLSLGHFCTLNRRGTRCCFNWIFQSNFPGKCFHLLTNRCDVVQQLIGSTCLKYNRKPGFYIVRILHHRFFLLVFGLRPLLVHLDYCPAHYHSCSFYLNTSFYSKK